MILKLRARHLRWTQFGNPCNCGLAKAARDQFKTENTKELMWGIVISERKYEHNFYGSEHFFADKREAKRCKFSDKVIREIRLTKINE